ncbi:hypothetical protein [Thermaerobacillus caldiproteolyticus]|uniref:hypothetical protein n=1 Tax=Thermaerobacillus caldiproteolyticus TaxID=247480 RepID=UPI00188CBFF0|nr:hypothetical protein [Anoxybacillus caldiproteolyticus]QPA31600.1 hypothetical protein ISX45_00815 [Anoxybacillus caldiproteolyticus]
MNVLPKDEQMALELKRCCRTSLHRALSAAIMERIDEAERWAKEFLRCKHDLDELIRRKEEHDQLVQIVKTLEERGIDIMLVVRKDNGQ